MAQINAQTDAYANPLGSSLGEIMGMDELCPGDAPSYQACKAIYTLHPFGAKIAESPVKVAQSQDREITISVASGIEDELVERFQDKWDEIDASGVRIGLHPGGKLPLKEHSRHMSIGLRVDDLDAAKKTLEERGVKFVKAPRDEGLRLAYFTDPDGNPMYLVEVKWG